MTNETPAMKGALMVITGNPEHFSHGFDDWLIENWQIWRRFEFEAFKIAKSERDHYSARTIMEFIRHETNLRETGSEFKINDHVTPDCARLFGLMHPIHANLFEYRRNKKRANFRAGGYAQMAKRQEGRAM